MGERLLETHTESIDRDTSQEVYFLPIPEGYDPVTEVEYFLKKERLSRTQDLRRQIENLFNKEEEEEIVRPGEKFDTVSELIKWVLISENEPEEDKAKQKWLTL